jgi:NADH-quinone oxidoreductase subunit C
MNDPIKDKLEAAFPDLKTAEPGENHLVVAAGRGDLIPVLNFLKSSGYLHLVMVSCVDRAREEEFELVYILTAYLERDDEYSEREKLRIIVKTRIPRADPEFTSITALFEIAEPYEREIHELFGVNFSGHPRLLPLFLERAYEIPPFRKDFDTRQYVKDVFDQIPPVKDMIKRETGLTGLTERQD